MTNLTDYIAINHWFMTVKEMEQETGAKNDTIRKICKRNEWTPISEADRVRELVMANAGGIIEELAEKAGCSPANIYKAARDLGIEVVSKKHATAISALPVMQRSVKYSLMHRAFNDSDPDGLKEELDIILGSDNPIKHIKDSYNQSPSPFGLADQLRGIK